MTIKAGHFIVMIYIYIYIFFFFGFILVDYQTGL